MNGLIGDLRHAVRSLARARAFSVVALATLALGLGMAAAAFAVLDTVLIRPLPFPSPDRLVLIHATVPPFNTDTVEITHDDAMDLARETGIIQSLALVMPYAGTATALDPPERIEGFDVSTSAFDTFGVQPILGRAFTAAEGEPGRDNVVILGHGFWQRLGGRADVIGQTLLLDEVPKTIVGVMPETFRVEVLTNAAAVYRPITREHFAAQSRAFRAFRGIARLQPGVTVEQADAMAATVGERLARGHPATNGGRTFTVRPLRDDVVAVARPAVLMVTGLVVLVLLIAGVNLASIVLARGVARAREMAVRGALGASRWRMARGSLAEASLLSAGGALLGFLVAQAVVAAITAAPEIALPRRAEIAVDARAGGVIALAAAAAALAMGLAPFLLHRRVHDTTTLRTGHETAGAVASRLRAWLVAGQTAFAFGLAPAIQAATGRSMTLLRGARVTGGAHAGAGTRRVLMFAEVALALVLVAGAGLMLRTMGNLLSVDTGFRTEQVISAQFNLPTRYDAQKRLVFFDRAIERVRAVPGVTNAAFTYALPVVNSTWNSIFVIEGQPVPPRSELPSSGWIPISNGYFETMGIRLVRGRTFEASDGTSAPAVVVVNQTFARRFFGDNNPVGARVKQGWPEDKAPWREIVGVVNDVKVNGLQGDPALQAYMPVAQAGQRSGALVARADGDPRRLGRAIEAAVQEIDPNLPLFDVRTMSEVIDGRIGNQRLTMVLLMGFAALALLMAAIGVFGVTAYSVSQRTHELGVRMALGAGASSVVALVLRQELAACLIGIGAGLVGAVFLSSLLDSLLFGVAARDPLTLSAAAGVLLVVTVVACLIPARRATRVDPVIALRLE